MISETMDLIQVLKMAKDKSKKVEKELVVDDPKNPRELDPERFTR